MLAAPSPAQGGSDHRLPNRSPHRRPVWWASLTFQCVLLAVAVLLLSWLDRRSTPTLPGVELPGLWASLALPLALAGLALCLRGGGRLGLMALLGLPLCVLLIMDGASLEYFLQPVHLKMAVALPQIWEARASAGTLLPATAWLPVWFFVALVPLAVAVGRADVARRRTRLAGLLLLLVAAPGLWVTSDDEVTRRARVEQRHASLQFAAENGLGVFHLHDALELAQHGLFAQVLNPDERRAISLALDHKWQLNQAPSPLFGIAAGRNVLVVQLEAFQGFLMDLDTPAGPVVPHLRALAAEGLAFEHLVDSTGVGRTSDAEFSVMTSLLPHEREPIAMTRVASQRWVTLPRELRRSGYATLTLHGYRPGFWNRAVAHSAYGVERLVFADDFRPGRELAWGLADEEVFTQTVELLARGPAPWFAYLISLSSHHPFDVVPPELADWPTGLPEGTMAARYLRSAHYTDRALGELVDRLRAAGLWEHTVLVVFGDHVAGLDRDSRTLLSQRTGQDLSDPAARVTPLVIVVPGQEAALAAQRDALVGTWLGLQDLAPTLLHLLGMPSPRGFRGTHAMVPPAERDLLPFVKGGGYVAGGELQSIERALPEGDPDAVARISAGLAAARREVWINTLILEHDAQVGRAGAADARADAGTHSGTHSGTDAGAPALALPEPDATLVRWKVSYPAGSRALTGARALVVVVPDKRTGFTRQLQLTNTGTSDAIVRLVGRDLQGRPVLQRRYDLSPGAVETVLVRAGMQPGGAPVHMLEVQGPAHIDVESWLSHSREIVPWPVRERVADVVHFEGQADGNTFAGVFLASTAEQPTEVTCRAFLDDAVEPFRSSRWTLPARGGRYDLVPLEGLSGTVRLEIEGRDLVVSVVPLPAELSAGP